jgi:hypothetical protein
MVERHFESEDEIREFVTSVAEEYRDEAEEWGRYEAATTLYKESDLCPWSITKYFESSVPYDELSGPDPRDMIEHEAILCIEEILEKIYLGDK